MVCFRNYHANLFLLVLIRRLLVTPMHQLISLLDFWVNDLLNIQMDPCSLPLLFVLVAWPVIISGPIARIGLDVWPATVTGTLLEIAGSCRRAPPRDKDTVIWLTPMIAVWLGL
jgi:hypothetical protein